MPDESDTGTFHWMFRVWTDPGFWASLGILVSSISAAVALTTSFGVEYGVFIGYPMGLFAGDVADWAKERFTRGVFS